MPPKSKKGGAHQHSGKDAAARDKDKRRTAALRRILEDCSELRKSTPEAIPPTMREISALRQAFRNVMEGEPEHSWPNIAVQCDNVLWQVEKDAASNAESKTGDEDREMKTLGENWKFRQIPKRRRLQTLVVSLTGFFTALPFWISLSLYLTFFNYFTMPVMVLYWAYIFFIGAKHPGKKVGWYCRHWFWKTYRDYFPIRLVIPKNVRKAITPDKNYLFCYHPHGVMSFGVLPNFATDANNLSQLLPGITVHVQTLGINFIVPFWRELIISAGMGDASAATIRKTLNGPPGRSALLVVGGAEEALLSSPKTNRLTLTKRKGFVKLALERGAPLVPCFGFGETNTYGNYADGRPWLQKLLVKMQKKLGFAIPLVKGRGWFNYNFGPLPHRRQIITVVGAPVMIPKIEKPTKADVDHWHAKYLAALTELYEENKPVYDVYTQEGIEVVN